MSFPLYKNDLEASVFLTDKQKTALKSFLSQVKTRNIKMVKNHCICGNDRPENDMILSRKDRFGIPGNIVICDKCGLIRSAEVFDYASNIDFYKNYYRDIYVGNLKTLNDFFDDQVNRGRYFLQLLKKYLNGSEIGKVVEIGCGAGGILLPFLEEKREVLGVDFDKDYLEFGRKKGISLLGGNFADILENDSADLIILSHVMEHFPDPLSEIQNIISKVREDGHIILEVPGIFNIHKAYLNPVLYLQNAHVYYYFYQFLKVFFEACGLEVIYGDEKCLFVLRKKKGWVRRDLKAVFDNSLIDYPKRIKNYFILQFYLNKFSLQPWYWRKKLREFMLRTGFRKS
jgi:SAM-dependent methyltransferase